MLEILAQLIQVLVGALIKLGQRLTGRVPVPVRVQAQRPTSARREDFLFPRSSVEMARSLSDPFDRFRR